MGGKGLLQLKRGTTAAKDVLVWKWPNGFPLAKSAFGSPLIHTDYALCIFDESGGVATERMRVGIRAGGTCLGRPCWKETATGFAYKDPRVSPDGVLKMLLKEGPVPPKRPKISLKGKGSWLGVPTLPLAQDPEVRVQLRTRTVCWAATFAQRATKNEPKQFKDKDD